MMLSPFPSLRKIPLLAAVHSSGDTNQLILFTLLNYCHLNLVSENVWHVFGTENIVTGYH